MTEKERRAVCPECYDSGQPTDDCRMCLALNGELDPEDIDGSFLGALNSVGVFRNAIDHHKETSVAYRMRMAREGETVNRQVDSRQALRMLPQDYTSVEMEEIPDTRTPEDVAEDAAIAAQARAEGVDLAKDGNTLARRVEFMDKHFRIADKVGLMPLMEFAYHANSGMDTSDMAALAAIFEMLKDCIHPNEWDRFRAHAKATKADAEDLLPVVHQTVELLTARPTQQESDSSAPSRQTSDSLTDTSSGQREQLVSVGEVGRLASLG